MLFYFQFQAKASVGEQHVDPLLVHSLIQAETVDAAAEQITNSMRSVHLKIGDIRRAFAVRTTEELGDDRHLLTLAKQAERSSHAFLFEFANGTEALYGPSLAQFTAPRFPYPATQKASSGLKASTATT